MLLHGGHGLKSIALDLDVEHGATATTCVGDASLAEQHRHEKSNNNGNGDDDNNHNNNDGIGLDISASLLI